MLSTAGLRFRAPGAATPTVAKKFGRSPGPRLWFRPSVERVARQVTFQRGKQGVSPPPTTAAMLVRNKGSTMPTPPARTPGLAVRVALDRAWLYR